METTKLSTKGQIVIPEQMRADIKEGTVFVVTKQNDLIILKQVKGLTEEEKEEMQELDKIWKDIAKGECKRYTEKEFFDEFKKW